MAIYYIFLRPDAGKSLRDALETDISKNPNETLKRLLSELKGIGEIDRGFPRQLILSKPECRLLSELNASYELNLSIPSI